MLEIEQLESEVYDLRAEQSRNKETETPMDVTDSDNISRRHFKKLSRMGASTIESAFDEGKLHLPIKRTELRNQDGVLTTPAEISLYQTNNRSCKANDTCL